MDEKVSPLFDQGETYAPLKAYDIILLKIVSERIRFEASADR